MYTCFCSNVAECFLFKGLIFRDVYKNKVGVRAIWAKKYKKVWRENLLAHAHLSCECTQIKYSSQKMAQQVWNIKKIERHKFWKNYLPMKSNRTALQTYKVEERTFGTHCKPAQKSKPNHFSRTSTVNSGFVIPHSMHPVKLHCCY